VDAFYAIYLITTIRFFLHHGILVFPIPKKTLHKVKSTKNLLIQYPVRNEPEHLIQRFLLSLKSIPFEHRKRIHVQILDDYDKELTLSFDTNNIISELAPISIRVLKRPKRWGNKAGNMNYGLSKTCLKTYPYVAIFDADHIVDGTGMIEALDVLEGNPDIICVQSRWTFNNLNNTPLSMVQEQFMGIHINREQTFRSVHNLYPIFNGAGGIWRVADVMKVSGGWLERCVCEDTDLSGVVNMRGYKIHVLSTWTTGIDLAESWDALQKQMYRWITANGQQLQHHVRDPNGWNWKKLYWVSWNLAFFIAPIKYIIPIYIAWKSYYHVPWNFYDLVGGMVHLTSWTASCLTWDNKFNYRGLFTYPLFFIFELKILHHQIKGFWNGIINWKKHLEFVVTLKGQK